MVAGHGRRSIAATLRDTYSAAARAPDSVRWTPSVVSQACCRERVGVPVRDDQFGIPARRRRGAQQLVHRDEGGTVGHARRRDVADVLAIGHPHHPVDAARPCHGDDGVECEGERRSRVVVPDVDDRHAVAPGRGGRELVLGRQRGVSLTPPTRGADQAAARFQTTVERRAGEVLERPVPPDPCEGRIRHEDHLGLTDRHRIGGRRRGGDDGGAREPPGDVDDHVGPSVGVDGDATIRHPRHRQCGDGLRPSVVQRRHVRPGRARREHGHESPPGRLNDRHIGDDRRGGSEGQALLHGPALVDRVERVPRIPRRAAVVGRRTIRRWTMAPTSR